MPSYEDDPIADLIETMEGLRVPEDMADDASAEKAVVHNFAVDLCISAARNHLQPREGIFDKSASELLYEALQPRRFVCTK